jgi:hypothetical protein
LCLEPVSAEPISARDGVAELSVACQRARCDSSGYLSAEVSLAEGRAVCTLRKGLDVVGELPAAAVGFGIEVRMTRVSDGGLAAKLAIAKAADRTVARFVLPSVVPGRYALEFARTGDDWSCRADLGPLGPGRHRINPERHDPMKLTVRVADPEDKPLSGVPIRTFHGAPQSSMPPGNGKPGTGAWSCASSVSQPTATDQKGSARVAATSGEDALIVAGDWKDTRGIAVEVLDRPPASPVTLKLTRPVRLRAKLLDEKDRPVGCRASYEIVAPEARWVASALPGGGTNGSCADGGLAIGPFLPKGGTLAISPTPGMPIRLTIDPPTPGATVDLGVIRVHSGESIRVMVRDADGHAIPKAKVSARGKAGIVTSIEGTTDDTGNVELAGLPKAATISLEVKAAGFISGGKDALPIAESPYTVVLTRGGIIEGSVHDREGAPIAGATVNASSPNVRFTEPATSGSDGAFAMTALPDGVFDLAAHAAGYADAPAVRAEVRDRHPDRSVDFVLDSASPFRGHAVDAAGSPVAGARVFLISRWDADDLGRARIAAETNSGTDGVFELATEVDPNQWLVALYPGLAPGVERSPANAQKQGDVVVVLGEAAGLRVHTTVRGGVPRRIHVVDGLGLGHEAAETGAGDTTFDGLGPGQAKVSLSGATPKDVPLAAGQNAEVTLDDAPWIEGYVTADQVPAARVLVHAGQEDLGRFERGGGGVFTDQRGAYRLDGLAEGPWRVVAIGEDGRAEKTITLPSSGPTRVDLDLRMARLELTVLRADRDEPIPQIAVGVNPAGATCSQMTGTTVWGSPGDLGFDLQVGSNGCLSGLTDTAGVAHLVLAGPGSYGISIQDRGYEPYDAQVAVAEGTTSRRVRLTPKSASGKGTVHVRLTTDPPGLAGTLTCVQGGSTWSTSPVVNQQDCGDLRPGPANVVFHVEGYGAGRASVEVPDGADVTVDLGVVRGGKLIVPVSAAGNSPQVVDGSGFIWANPTGHGIIQGVASDLPDVGKSWVFDDLPPGMYTVTVDGTPRSPVPVLSGATTTAN